jgi:hypothetical protein
MTSPASVREVLRAALEHAQSAQPDTGFGLLAPHRELLRTDREVALTFCELLSVSPTFVEALAWAELVAAGFEADPDVVIPLAAALIRVAELRPADEPPFMQGPAHLAAGVCQRCFERLSPSQRQDPNVGGYLQLNMADGLRMMGPEYNEDALAAYRLALAVGDDRGAWWFHLGIFYKWRGRYKDGLEANQKAYSRGGPQRPVLWNIAICATALGEGALAVEAWEKLGIHGTLNAAGMPQVDGVPAMQVRVATMGEDFGQHDPLPAKAVSFEVVWVSPLSPCHGVVVTPTARRANVDYGDVVLWDGAPVRVQQVDGKPVPTFPILSILRAGDERRLRFVGMEKGRGAVEAMQAALGQDVSVVVFDRRHQGSVESELFYGKIIVPTSVELSVVKTRLEQVLRERVGLTFAVPQLYELLGETHAAGKSHQAWGGIEKVAERQGLLPKRSGQ